MGTSSRHDGPLSPVDRALLDALIEDGRATFTAVGERVQVSGTTVRRRVSEFERCGIIRGYTVLIDPAALGLPTAALFSIKLRSGAPTEPSIGEKLYSLPEISASYTLSGDRPHVAVGRYICPDAAKAAADRLEENLCARIRLDFVLETRFGDRIWSAATPVEQPLRDIDRFLLDILMTDGRAQFETLARKMNVSTSTAHKRLRALEDRGVIRGYTTLVDPAALGLPVTAVFTIQSHSDAPTDPSISERLRGFPEIRACYTLSGRRPAVAIGGYPDIAAAHATADRLRDELHTTVGIDFVLATDFHRRR